MASGGGNRRQRIESEMQRVLAMLISREVKDPRVGLATVTAVRLANDMGSARIFVLPFGGAAGGGDGASLIEGLTPDTFYDPVHGRIWSAISARLANGRRADPVTVWEAMKDDAGLVDFGGMAYLGELLDKAPPTDVAVDYVPLLLDVSKRRELILISSQLEQTARAGTGKDALEWAEGALLGLAASHSPAKLVSAAQAADDVLAYLDAPEDDADGFLTGIQPLDEHLGRLLAGDLVLIPGRPGMGKSALAACIALNVARQGIGVIEINSEMSTAQMMRRHLTDLAFERHGRAAPTYKDIRRRRVSPEQYRMLVEARDIVSSLPLMMVKRSGLTLSSLRSMIRRQAATWAGQGIRLGMVSMDHVGLMQADGGGKDRYTDQTGIAIGMKQLADELGIPVVALVQLSRKVEDRDNKRPQLADMRDSGAWEENADIVIGAYRDAYYANKEPEPKDDGRPNSLLKWNDWDARKKSKTIEAILLKVREGEEGIVPLWASIGHNAIRGAEPHGELL